MGVHNDERIPVGALAAVLRNRIGTGCRRLWDMSATGLLDTANPPSRPAKTSRADTGRGYWRWDCTDNKFHRSSTTNWSYGQRIDPMGRTGRQAANADDLGFRSGCAGRWNAHEALGTVGNEPRRRGL